MTGELENPKICPLCGGRLQAGVATIPFTLKTAVVIIKGVPAEICRNCHEPYTVGRVTDRLVVLVNLAQAVPVEVAMLAYLEPQAVPPAVETVAA
jgi:YgiT-type zinc finger domain-containing protein